MLLPVVSPSKILMSNYIVLLAPESGISINNNQSIPKTNTCCTTDNYIINVANFAFGITYSHYIPVSKEDLKIKKDRITAPLGVNIMYNMTSEALGNIPVGTTK